MERKKILYLVGAFSIIILILLYVVLNISSQEKVEINIDREKVSENVGDISDLEQSLGEIDINF